MLMRQLIKTAFKVIAVLSLAIVGSAVAAPAAVSLTSIATNVNKSVSGAATIISDVSLIAGVSFVMSSFFKFHQHKLNPTQVPLSQGISMLLVGAGLCLFPTLLLTTSKAMFGVSSINQIGGTQIGSIVGGST